MLITNIKNDRFHLCHFKKWLISSLLFQVISYCQRKLHRDVHRFEKISNIIKQFKLSCSKLAASFQSMEVRNSSFAAFIDVFTSNTYVMVIMSDPSIRKYEYLASKFSQLFIITNLLFNDNILFQFINTRLWL